MATEGIFHAKGIIDDTIEERKLDSNLKKKLESYIIDLKEKYGELIFTNNSFDNILCSHLTNSETLYFGTSNKGVLKLDTVNGNIINTNKTTDSFGLIFTAGNGNTYFGSASNKGIWKLDITNNVVQHNSKINGNFKCYFTTQNGTTYVGGSGLIRIVNNSDNILSTSRSIEIVNGIAADKNGIIYIATQTGIFKNTSESTFITTNITTGSFTSCILDTKGDLYFTSSVGIYKLDYISGNIILTNITVGSFNGSIKDNNGRIYFYGNNGIYKLDDDGTIILTNIITGNFITSYVKNNDTYFSGTSGLFILNSTSGLILKVSDISFTTIISHEGITYFGGVGIMIFDKRIYGRIKGEWVNLTPIFVSKDNLSLNIVKI